MMPDPGMVLVYISVVCFQMSEATRWLQPKKFSLAGLSCSHLGRSRCRQQCAAANCSSAKPATRGAAQIQIRDGAPFFGLNMKPHSGRILVCDMMIIKFTQNSTVSYQYPSQTRTIGEQADLRLKHARSTVH